MLLGLLLLACGLALAACVLARQPRFGSPPEGARLKAIEKSPNFADGRFTNQIPTPMLTEDTSFLAAVWSVHFAPKVRPAPSRPVPTVRTDFAALDASVDTVVWLGHSSYYIQLAGKRILADPVFSDYASPFSFINKAFDGATVFTAGRMPPIDYLLVTHDHWDHLDYRTVADLRDKVRNVVCPLGVGAHFESWGYPGEAIHEADWYGTVQLDEAIAIHVLPARHYSGRRFEKNRTLWAGFALTTPQRRVFISGDSGYGPHFADIGRRFGGFDLAILDCGQYDRRWAYIHMTPEEAARAAVDLRAQAVMPAHVGRFSIANHPWDEPFERFAAASREKPYRLLTPRIGEPVPLGDATRNFARWWAEVENPDAMARSESRQ